MLFNSFKGTSFEFAYCQLFFFAASHFPDSFSPDQVIMVVNKEMDDFGG